METTKQKMNKEEEQPEQIEHTQILSSTDNEKESLIKEILQELKDKEYLKSEILKELKLPNDKKSLSNFIQHPLFLLFLGFILTGILGTWLTSFYQKRDWERQQQRLVRTDKAETKLQIINDLIKAVAENDASTRGIQLEVMFLTESNINKKIRTDSETEREISEAFKFTRNSYRKWLTDEALLEQKIKIYFRNPQITELFDNINKERHSAYVNFTLLVGSYNEDKEVFYKENADFNKIEKQSGEIGKETLSFLREIVNLMYAEVNEELAIN